MQTVKKPMTISKTSSAARPAAAKRVAAMRAKPRHRINWSKGTVTLGGGVAAAITILRRTRGPNKKPTKQQVAIRLDREVLEGFQASGPAWQTRMNAALKEWLTSQSVTRKSKTSRAA